MTTEKDVAEFLLDTQNVLFLKRLAEAATSYPDCDHTIAGNGILAECREILLEKKKKKGCEAAWDAIKKIPDTEWKQLTEKEKFDFIVCAALDEVG